MWSPEDDRTARARIRDEALRLFGERGPDAVTVRNITSAARVSPALVVRHYQSKDGLREAVDGYVSAVFEAMLAEFTGATGTAAFDQDRVPSLAEMVAARFSADTAIPAYLGRLLVAEGPTGSTLFRRLYDVSRNALSQMTASGLARDTPDPQVRAAVMLVNDLAVLILRERLHEVLGVDPLSGTGMRRWGAEVMSIYRSGIGPAGEG
jgi:AcrR family transcriptional regulator